MTPFPSTIRLSAALLALAIPMATAVHAQVVNTPDNAPPPGAVVNTPGNAPPPPDDAKHSAVDAQEQPVTRTLNNSVQGNIEATKVINATNQGQYEADMAQYRADVEEHHRTVMRDARRYARQQRAFADAMATWREQVAKCNAGSIQACRAPTPNPADYY